MQRYNIFYKENKKVTQKSSLRQTQSKTQLRYESQSLSLSVP
jgi:hypothetical protein